MVFGNSPDFGSSFFHHQPPNGGPCFLEDPDVVMAKVNHFAFLGRGFKHSVHEIVNLIETSFGKLGALWVSKLDQMRVDGEPHNPSGPSFTPGSVRGGDETTQRQGLFPAIGFHGLKYKPETVPALWGVHPT